MRSNLYLTSSHLNRALAQQCRPGGIVIRVSVKNNASIRFFGGVKLHIGHDIDRTIAAIPPRFRVQTGFGLGPGIFLGRTFCAIDEHHFVPEGFLERPITERSFPSEQGSSTDGPLPVLVVKPNFPATPSW